MNVLGNGLQKVSLNECFSKLSLTGIGSQNLFWVLSPRLSFFVQRTVEATIKTDSCTNYFFGHDLGKPLFDGNVFVLSLHALNSGLGYMYM